MGEKEALFGCAFSPINLRWYVHAIQGCFQWWLAATPFLSPFCFLFRMTNPVVRDLLQNFLPLSIWFVLGYIWYRHRLCICNFGCCNFKLPSCRHFLLGTSTQNGGVEIEGFAKIVGIIACIAGAITLALYKGPHFNLLCPHHLFESHNSHGIVSHAPSSQTRLKGCFLLFVSNILWGLWLVLQCFLSTIQLFAIAIGFERDPREWELGWNVRLLAVAYCGIVVTGVTFYLQAWIIEKKGPVFLAKSTPVNLVFTMFFSAILLCEIITLGSYFNSLFKPYISLSSLYSVLWGKSKEEKMNDAKCLKAEVDKERSELKQVVPVKSIRARL
ncbi:WAT1-related protein [Populus alba x Populus x berolinensis]|nr:WAT1-related protein [Populus alba x Populus x berolinensis]